MKRKRAKKTPLIELLRMTTFAGVYGELTEHWGVRPSVSKDQFIQRRRSGFFLPSLSNVKLERHFAGQDTYYFFGNPKKSASHTLAIIDIDVQKARRIGSSQGADAFADHLKKTYWPGLCWEKSRSGNGLGCPVFVKKDGRSAEDVNAMLRKLDHWLKAEACKIGADIENVEVKGTLPIISYRYGEAESIRFGQFARYPKSLTFEQLSDSPELSCEEWLLKDVPEPEKKKRDEVASALNVGSVSGQLISDEDLAMIPHYERLYRRLVGSFDLKATGRFIVTAHDFAVECVLLRFFKMNPNKDGTMPTSRAKALWTKLYEKGQVQRPFNARRWARIRDWLSEHGHIDWQDDRFQAPNPAQGLRPIACKWAVTDEFMELLQSMRIRQETASFVDTIDVQRGPGQWLTPRLYPIQYEVEANFWLDADDRVEMLMAA